MVKQLLERDIERHLVRRVKELGGEVRKVQWIGRRGAPDRLVMCSRASSGSFSACSTIWVELKAPGVKPDAHQLREHERMRRMGQRVVVVDSLERVDEVLRDTGEHRSYRKLFQRHEHRVVAEQMLGRPLAAGEIVHHIDGNVRNNDPSNLQVMTQADHIRQHHPEMLAARRAIRGY